MTLQEYKGSALLGKSLISSCLNPEGYKQAQANLRFIETKLFEMICDVWEWDIGKVRQKIYALNINILLYGHRRERLKGENSKN